MRLVSASKWYPPPADHDGHHVDRVYRLRLVAFVPLRDGRRRVVAVVERSDFEGELGTMLRRGLVVFAASLLLALFQGPSSRAA